MSEPLSVDLAGVSVLLAMPTSRDLHPLTVKALLETQALLTERGIPLEVQITFGGSLIHHSRSKAAWLFLSQSKANRLFWVDSDMVWEPPAFLRLVALTVALPIVAGAYIAKQDPPTFMVQRGDMAANEYGCFAFDGLGMGFCCVRREVVEALAEASPKLGFHDFPEPIPSIFGFGEDARQNARGEDMQFFADAKALGYQLWVDPTIKLGHIGPKVYTARLKDFLTPKEPADGLPEQAPAV